MKQNASKISSTYLKDFDWSLRLALSSDSISGRFQLFLFIFYIEMHEPLVLLTLNTVNTCDNLSNDRTWEMSKRQMDSLLSTFSEISSRLECLE